MSAAGIVAEAIPEKLEGVDQWVNWARIWNANKARFSKPPMTANGRNASSTDEKTWTTLADSLAALGRPGVYVDSRGTRHRVTLDGVGLAGMERTPFAGIDIDHCIDFETGEISPYAMEIVREFDSYTERTVSETGLRIWIEAEKPPGSWCASKNDERELEVYDRGRFFTVTGLHLDGTPRTIERRQGVLETFMKREAPPEKPRPVKAAYSGPGGPEYRLELDEFLQKHDVIVLGPRNDQSSERAYTIVCPWVREHTGGDESGTRVGQYPSGGLWFHCDHGHCDGRIWEHFREHFEPGCYEPWWVKVAAKNG
jgi:hypothetical protein